MQQKYYNSERGVVLIEIAIIFPLLIALLFMLHDCARFVVAYSGVKNGVAIATRRAAGIDRPEWKIFQKSSVPRIEFLYRDDEHPPLHPPQPHILQIDKFSSLYTLIPEFVSSPDYGDWYEAMAQGYDSECYGFPCDRYEKINTLFRVELRAIAYAYKILSQSVWSIDYPCDANTPELSNTPGHPGCARCFTLRGEGPNYLALWRVGNRVDNIWSAKMLGIYCSYDAPISSAAILLGLIPSHVTITSKAYVNLDNLPDTWFNPGERY